ncbi:MAG: DNA replication and repair protein RecF, partial [bacterium]|nr:DNA replication and repair protein RecF [bacterium]
RDLRRFGSQGQHRLAALTLKLESARWIEYATGDAPILLLDDFGSELDPARRAAVLQGLRGAMQVIVTATHPSDLASSSPLFDQARRIESGRLLA